MGDLRRRYEGSCNHGVTVTDTMTMEGECKECGASIEWVVPATIDCEAAFRQRSPHYAIKREDMRRYVDAAIKEVGNERTAD